MHDRVAQFFASDGPLARQLPGYEVRPGQLQLAQAICTALTEERSLVAEAGTGTGKTLAYLVPALLSGRRVVISTGTKNLQEQLIGLDLPLAERALKRRFPVQIMKGRSNYLCELRAERALQQLALPGLTAGSRPLRTLQAVQQWRLHTNTGDRAELAALADDSPLWPQLSATFEQCLGSRCSQAERCWLLDARRRAQTAAVIVVNHHLYLADTVLRAGSDEPGIALLPPHDLVIFDEAHDLEDMAAQHFGCEVSEARLRQLLEDLRAELPGHGTLSSRLQPTLEALQAQTTTLFACFSGDQRSRLDSAAPVAEVQAAQAALDSVFERLEASLADVQDEALKALARRCGSVAQQLAFCLDQPPRRSLVRDVPESPADDQAFVRYVDGGPGHRSLVARPLDVTEILGRSLRRTPAVYVSATLRVAGSFAHCRRRLGIDDAVTELHAESPFDYASQVHLYLPDDLPDADRPNYPAAAATRAAALVGAAGGGALILCTSHRALGQMRQALLQADLGPVLTQGEAPKHLLLRSLRERQDAVLVATLSFWQGVDVPGPALRLVIIDRLPFAAPTEPWLEARLAHLRAQGQDPFMQHQLPQAALLLRQGFGRLIRRRDDCGVVAILDHRLTSRRYGPLLLRSLPTCPRLTGWLEVEAVLRAQRPNPQIAS